MKHTIAILLLIIVALSMSVAMGAGSLQAPLVTSATASQTDEPDTAQLLAQVAALETADVALMLDFLGHKAAHDAVLKAIETVLDPASGGPRTPDLGGRASTQDVGKAIAQTLVSQG